jgi:hypothetical protein
MVVRCRMMGKPLRNATALFPHCCLENIPPVSFLNQVFTRCKFIKRNVELMSEPAFRAISTGSSPKRTLNLSSKLNCLFDP